MDYDQVADFYDCAQQLQTGEHVVRYAATSISHDRNLWALLRQMDDENDGLKY